MLLRGQFLFIMNTAEFLKRVNDFIALTESMEVGCPRHPGATAFGSQLQEGDRTDGWQNLTTQP